MSEMLSIGAHDGSFGAYVARPRAAAAPVLVVVQEIFGINADMRATCDDFAAQGYLAVCPDLFWRLEPGIQLTDRTQAEWDRAFALYKAFDLDAGVKDIAATLAAARALPDPAAGASTSPPREAPASAPGGARRKAGVVGFCLGGLLTYLAALRTDCDAAVAYYGGGIDQHLAEAKGLARPLLLHLAEEDEFISKDAQRAIHAALGKHPLVEIHSYPGCQHAFARHDGVHEDADAAQKAHARTAAFFRKHLAGA